jgi:uncharacterized membrane protein
MQRNLQQTLHYGRLLTVIFVYIIYLINFTKADLAPNEEDDDSKAQIDLKTQSTTAAPSGINTGFIHAFIAAFSVIIVSEIGDKTFFIAAIMSMVIKLKLFTRKNYNKRIFFRNIHD